MIKTIQNQLVKLKARLGTPYQRAARTLGPIGFSLLLGGCASESCSLVGDSPIDSAETSAILNSPINQETEVGPTINFQAVVGNTAVEIPSPAAPPNIGNAITQRDASTTAYIASIGFLFFNDNASISPPTIQSAWLIESGKAFQIDLRQINASGSGTGTPIASVSAGCAEEAFFGSPEALVVKLSGKDGTSVFLKSKTVQKFK